MTANLKIEPKIGEIITINGVKYITQLASGAECSECALRNSDCWDIACNQGSRKDCKAVILKKVETNMNEVKIQIPDNCELIKDGNTYIVKEKKQEPPRSWEEFCEKYPIRKGEANISVDSVVLTFTGEVFRDAELDKNICISKEEGKAFLALMQLRQLRKAWVGDWEPSRNIKYAVILIEKRTNRFEVGYGYWEYNYALTLPTKEMAEDFLGCFGALCETAKLLL